MTNQSETDIKYMQMAIDLALNGKLTTLPNPCVGCVLVKDDRIIGKGYHRKTGTGHAEVNAITNAKELGNDISGATAYVTLEPCSHYGLTPPCAVALVNNGVKRVVCAMIDPNPLVSGKGIKILEDAGIEVKVGVLKEKAETINIPFLYSIKNNLPYVTLKFGISADGRIALSNGASKWITSEKSRSDVQFLRAQHQAIMTTAATVLADDPSMNVRIDEISQELIEGIDHNLIHVPLKVIIDKHEQLTMKEKIFSTSGKVLLVRPSISGELKEEEISDKLTILRIPAIADQKNSQENSCRRDFNIMELFTYLNSKRIRNVMVESGPNFAGFLFKHGLINKLVLYVAPKLMGTDAISFCSLTGFDNMNDIPHMKLENCSIIGDDIKLEYVLKE